MHCAAREREDLREERKGSTYFVRRVVLPCFYCNPIMSSFLSHFMYDRIDYLLVVPTNF